MTRIFTLLLLSIISIYGLIGQTVLLGENFNSCENWGPFPPDNWTVSERAQNYATDSFYVNTNSYPYVPKHWYSSTDQVQAGGDICELVLNNYPYTESGMYRVISPIVDATGYTSLTLSFKQKLSKDPDHETDSFYVGAATTSDGGVTWNEVWNSGTITQDINQETKSITISNADVGSPNFQFCLFFDGDFYVLGDWRIDDIELVVPVQNDILVSAVLGEAQFAMNDTYTPEALVQNLGTLSATFDIQCKITDFESGSEVYNNTVNTTMSAGEVQNVLFPNFTIPQNGRVYNVEVTSLFASDEVSGNNTANKDINTWTTQRQNVLLEVSTYITCAACPTAALGATTINQDYNVSVIEHHTSSDPAPQLYSTQDGRDRLSYFGSSGAPSAWFDISTEKSGGCPSMNCIDEYLPIYEQAITVKTPILINMAVNETATPDIYDVTVTINKQEVVANNNLRLMLTLTESHVPENWSTVEPVLTELDFINRVMYPDVNGTNIDLVSNNEIIKHYTVDASAYNYTLQLIAWVEDHENKYVYQTEEFDLADAGTVSVSQIENDNINVYPNPCSSILNVTIDNLKSNNQDYRIANILGETVLIGQLKQGVNTIDVSNLPNGNYILTNNETFTKFVVFK